MIVACWRRSPPDRLCLRCCLDTIARGVRCFFLCTFIGTATTLRDFIGRRHALRTVITPAVRLCFVEQRSRSDSPVTANALPYVGCVALVVAISRPTPFVPHFKS